MKLKKKHIKIAQIILNVINIYIHISIYPHIYIYIFTYSSRSLDLKVEKYKENHTKEHDD